MAHFAYTKIFGVWPSNQVLHATELADFDAKTFKSLNADEGGVWAPSSPVILGGMGLQVPANVILGTGGTTSLTVDSTCAFDYQAGFFGIVLTHADVMIGDDNTTTATVNSNLVINSGFVANANSSFAGSGVHLSFGTGTTLSLATGSSLVCSASALFNASVTFADAINVDDDLTLAGAGAIVERVVTGSDSDSTYSVSSADTVFIPNTLSAPRQYLVDHVGAVVGKKMHFALQVGASASIEVDLVDTVSGRILPGNRIKNAASNYSSVTIQFIGGTWRMIDFAPEF